MQKSAAKFAPSNISLFFTTAKFGSKGLGITLQKGVIAKVELLPKFSENEIFFNRQKILLPTVERLIYKLTKKRFKIELESDLPLGAGFGLSASSALATGYAIRDILNLHKNDLQIARIAHQSEVFCGSGLGDVINEYFGGCSLKLKSSQFFERVQISLDKTKIYYKVFGPKPTKSLLNDPQKLLNLNKQGAKSIDVIRKLFGHSPTIKLKTLINLSYDFSFKSGLISTHSQNIINQIRNNGAAATTLLIGDGVISDSPFADCQSADFFDNQNRI